tara:strand:- start:6839 stop:7168 length:330 start_codon:yes stop_codon:yes gene_type:complete
MNKQIDTKEIIFSQLNSILDLRGRAGKTIVSSLIWSLKREVTKTQHENNWSGLKELADIAQLRLEDAITKDLANKDEKEWNYIVDCEAEHTHNFNQINLIISALEKMRK